VKLPRKVTHCLLAALALVTVVYRYPLEVGHEMGSDTTFIHSLAESISVFGQARWVVHPLSYFGLYALSYASGIPFVFAASSETSGVPIEGIMLLFGWIVALPGTWAAFLVARRLRGNDVFALLVAAFFTVAPFYIKDTTWVGSSRGFAIALIPPFILLLLAHLRSGRASYISLAFVLLVILATIHRMGFLAFFLLIAYAFAIPFHKITQRLRFALSRFETVSRYAIVVASFAGFGLVVYGQFQYPGIVGSSLAEQYAGSGVFQGDSFPVLLANMGISLTVRIGVLFPLAVLGLGAFLWHRPKEATDKYLLTTTVLFLPLLSLRDYIAEFLIFFFVVLLVLGLFSIYHLLRRRQKMVAMIITVVVAISFAASWEMKDYWRLKYSTDTAIPDETYSCALYLRYWSTGTIVANEGLGGGRIGAISGRPLLPFGGASYHRTGPQQLVWLFITPGSMSVQLIEIQKISFNTDEIFLPVNVRNAEIDWETMLFYREPALAQSQLQRYDVHYFVVDRSLPHDFFSYGSERPSILLSTILPSTQYVVYQTGSYMVWYRG